MFHSILTDIFLVVLAIIGPALLASPFLGWTQGVERLALSLAAGILAAYLTVFCLYLSGITLLWFWILPTAGVAHAIIAPKGIISWWRDLSTRRLLGRWALLALWCLGWQGLIVSYSGGGWAGDWLEHYKRAQFFLHHWPSDVHFLGLYLLPARPPLVNLWTAGLLSLTGDRFDHYQVITTLFSSLVVFPLTVLLRRWRADHRAENLLLILLMVSPLFLQNATFPWTKLGSAFFVLLAIAQLSPGAGGPSRERLVAGAVLLAGGMLAHYSVGPWIIALGTASAWTRRHEWSDKNFRYSILLAGLCAGVLFATWLGWALTVYGPTTTFTANTAVALAPGGTFAERAGRAVTNLWSTVSPLSAANELAPVDQTSILGRWRDQGFMLFQLKLPFAFGSIGGAVLLWQLCRIRWSKENRFWLISVPLIVVFGTVTHAQINLTGLTHIALQPLVLLGLVWLAGEAHRLPRWLGCVWAGGLALDLGLGIVLHFMVEALWLDRLLIPGLSPPQYLAAYTETARINWQAKSYLHLTYLADIVSPSICWVVLLTVSLTASSLFWRARTKTQY